MAATTLAGVRVEPPAGFALEETMVSLRVPAAEGYRDERTQTPVRPNLVIHRRPAVGADGDLSRAVARVRAELHGSVPGLSAVESEDIRFADGAHGVLLAYVMPAPKGLEICQLQALRLDGGTLTTLTISTERAHLTDERKVAYVRALLSAAPA